MADERHGRRTGGPSGRQRARPSPHHGGQDGSFQLVLVECLEEAGLRGSRTVEAEDVLLALARAGSQDSRDLLAHAGLDYDSLRGALEQERRAALASVGMADPDPSLFAAAPRDDRPTWGTSLREAMSRARPYLHRSRGGPAAEYALLLGVLLAGYGTVPRALALAGVDADALIGRLQRLARH